MSGVSEPEPKKPKVVASSSRTWRQKCIDTFDLQPVPNAWASKVPEGSEAAWERYYQVRIKKNEPKRPYHYDSDEEKDKKPAAFAEFSDIRQDEEDFDEESWDVECMNTWKEFMQTKIESLKSSEKLKCAWKWTPGMEEAFVWEDHQDLRCGTYLAYVWSPYAIPHAVALEHYYYRRVRFGSMGLHVTWSYALVDFEDEKSTRQLKSKDFTFICSNGFEDEELRADKIHTEKLTMITVNRIRTFLYGSTAQACKNLTCSDATLLELVFASMGTDIFGEDIIGSWLGYCWSPSSEECKQFLKDGVPAKDDDSDPPEDEYEYSTVTYLEHRIKEITNTLGPFSRHYRAPTIRDAPGYQSYDSGDFSNDENGPSVSGGAVYGNLGLSPETQRLASDFRQELDDDQRSALDRILRMMTGNWNM